MRGRAVTPSPAKSIGTSPSANRKKVAVLPTRHAMSARTAILRCPAKTGFYAVGDAAAVLDPACSHGVLRALTSGIMAASCIDASVRGRVRTSESMLLKRMDSSQLHEGCEPPQGNASPVDQAPLVIEAPGGFVAVDTHAVMGRQSSILVEPFSPLHHQCVAWILSG